jgi:hypothetical protein
MKNGGWVINRRPLNRPRLEKIKCSCGSAGFCRGHGWQRSNCHPLSIRKRAQRLPGLFAHRVLFVCILLRRSVCTSGNVYVYTLYERLLTSTALRGERRVVVLQVNAIRLDALVLPAYARTDHRATNEATRYSIRRLLEN